MARGSLRPAAVRTLARTATALLLPLSLAGCLASGSTSDSVGQRGFQVENPNDQVAFDYFVGQGLTDVQAAGIVGNLDQESGMDPTIAQEGGGPGRGIAQWSVGGRWDTSSDDNVVWYAGKEGASEWSLDLQLDFIWYELTTFGYGYSELKAATTVTEATDAFMTYYEICGTCDASNRVEYAEEALADYGSGSTPPPPTACTVDGVDGTCIDTSVCATMKGYVSTAGHCPGADDIQCCTPAQSSSSSSSSSSSGSSSSSSSSSGGSSSSSSSSSGGSSSSSSSSGSAPPTTCEVDGVEGTCIQTSLCAMMVGYTSTPGFCPGPASEECCTPPPSCTANGQDGTCILTTDCAAMGYTSTPGLCPGADDIQCCTP